MKGNIASSNALAVQRLMDAGAVVFGKTNVPKWSLDYVTTNAVFGTTGNPWQPHHVPGGSSGGAAAAISAGFSSLEIGTDLGGSIRLPSHFCGVYGFKPTFGAVSQRGYVDRVGEAQYDVDANHFGPIARSVEDLTIAFGIIAFHPDRGAEPRSSLADYRIGAWLDDDACPVDAPVLDRLQRAADATTDAGARMNSSRPGASLPDARAHVGPVIAHGHRGPEAYASPERVALRDAWAAWFEHHDVMLWPVSPTTAPRHDGRPITERRITVNGTEVAGTETIGWTGPINVLGLPSAVIPVGRAGDGLPVGMQVIAAWGNDRLALDVASRIDIVLTERGLGGFAIPPGFAA
jgi:amidase